MKDFTPYHDFPAADNVRSMNNGQRLEIRNVQVCDAVTRRLALKRASKRMFYNLHVGERRRAVHVSSEQ